MTIKTLFKLLALGALLAWAPPAHAGKFSDLGVFPSSGSYFIGYPEGAGTDLTPAKDNDAVFTASGAAKIVSTSTTSGHKPFRVLNAAGTEVLSTTQGGTTAGTFSGTLTGNAATASALAANGGNCTAGQYPLGVDASGAVEGCTAAGIGDAVKNSTQTFSGFNVFYGSTTFDMSNGSVTMFVATYTYVPAGSTSQATFIVAYATVTATFSGKYDVECLGNVSYGNNAGGISHISFMVNGAFISPMTASLAVATEYDASSRIHNAPFVRFPKANMSGTKSIAITFAATVAGSTVWPTGTGFSINPFFRCTEVF